MLVTDASARKVDVQSSENKNDKITLKQPQSVDAFGRCKEENVSKKRRLADPF